MMRLLMCFGSFWCRLRVMGGIRPIDLARAAWRVLMVCGLLRIARALSLAMRYILSFGLEIWGCLLWVG